MKKILSVALLCALSKLLNAQNTFPGSGNVGIGTTTNLGGALNVTIPISKTSSSWNNDNNAAFFQTNDIANPFALRFQIVGAANIGNRWVSLQTTDINSDDAGSLILQPAYGNVGIGTYAPRSKFHLMLDNGFSIIQRSNSSNYAGHYYGTGTGSSLDFNFFTGLRENSADYHILNGSEGSDALTIKAVNSYVGIGTPNPQANLDVHGNIDAIAECHFSFGENSYYDPNPGIANALKIGTNGLSVNGNSVFNDGLSIGTHNLSGYKLAVNGGIHAKSVNVDIINWPDYVFKPSYKLRSLSEIKTYIDQNHHLPDMPSEKEVLDKGLDLGEINKLLVKKVEELTIYILKQDEKYKKTEIENKREFTKLKSKFALIQRSKK